MTQQLIIKYCWSKCQNRSLGYFQNRLFFISVIPIKKQEVLFKLTSTKTQETCPLFFPPLTVKSYFMGFFHYWGNCMPYCVRVNEMRKRTKLSFTYVYASYALCSLKFTVKWHVAY